MDKQVDTRFKNSGWILRPNADGTLAETKVMIALTMDIRDELQAVVAELKVLRTELLYLRAESKALLGGIRKNTARRRRRAAK